MKDTIIQFIKDKIKQIVRKAKKIFIKSCFSKLEGILFYMVFSSRKIITSRSNKTILFHISFVDPPGMRLFQLFSHFLYCGYICYFDISFSRYMKLKRYGKKATLFKGVNPYSKKINSYSIVASDDNKYLKNTGDESLKIFLNFRVFEYLDNISKDDFFYPLVHHYKYNYPAIETGILSCALISGRKIGAFFVGNKKINTYNSDITKKLFNVTTRYDMFNYIIEKLPNEILYIPKNLESFLKDIELDFLKNKIVLLDINNFEIPREHYFKILLQTDFFIHMCGVIYPYCHNQIESMMAGCIPITQFSDFYVPPFQHEKDSVLFQSLDGLIDILFKINLGYFSSAIQMMRRNIVDYYKTNYSFHSFKEKLLHATNNHLNYVNYFITTGSNNIIQKLLQNNDNFI